MTFHHWPVMIFFILTFSTAAAIGNEDDASPAASFYDVLKTNGLPMGLFPKGISEFSVDPTSGKFELHFHYPSPCDAKFETRLRYQCNITGSVSYGKIGNLSGVAAQELFLWFPVKGIQVDIPSSGLIYFDVGVVFKQFSLSFFETPKGCNSINGRDDALVFFNDRVRNQVIENHSVAKQFTADERRLWRQTI